MQMRGKFSTKIDSYLRDAGNNRSELEDAINAFSDENDSLKLKALHFLIEGLKEHTTLAKSGHSKKLEAIFLAADSQYYLLPGPAKI